MQRCTTGPVSRNGHRVNSHQFFDQLRALVVKNQCSKVVAAQL